MLATTKEAPTIAHSLNSPKLVSIMLDVKNPPKKLIIFKIIDSTILLLTQIYVMKYYLPANIIKALIAIALIVLSCGNELNVCNLLPRYRK